MSSAPFFCTPRELVELLVDALAQDAALARVRGRPLDQRGRELGARRRRRRQTPAPSSLGPAAGSPSPSPFPPPLLGDAADRRPLAAGAASEAVAQEAEVARRRLARSAARTREALQVADAAERVAQLVAGARVQHEELDLVEAAGGCRPRRTSGASRRRRRSRAPRRGDRGSR